MEGTPTLESKTPKSLFTLTIIGMSGPLASIGLGYLLLNTFLSWNTIASVDDIEKATLLQQLWCYTGIFNLVFGFINMIPAWPFDGGRLLALFIAPFSGLLKSISHTCTITKFLAVAFGAWAVINFNIVWVFVSVFCFWLAHQKQTEISIYQGIKDEK